MVDLLRKHFVVDILLVGSNREDVEKTLTDQKLKYDLVVLWQIDWLAAYFLALGFKTVVIPMFDGSSTLDNIHWEKARGALFINFSLNLHNIISAADCESIYVRYFPIINKSNIEAEKSYQFKPTAFFWERRPDTLLNLNEICRLLGNSISHLHIHQAPDPGFSPSDLPEGLPFTISTSSWFPNSNQYLECVCSHDIYVAPRYTEGIGMGFLEAMALGRVVVAHDEPTHNEYIKNYHNGILFNAFRKDVIDVTPDKIKKISKNAALDAVNFRNSWECFYESLIIKKIKNYLAENSSKNPVIKIPIYLRKKILDGLLNAHINWDVYYNTLNSLDVSMQMKNSKLTVVLPDVNRFELEGNYAEAVVLLSKKTDFYGNDSPYHLFLALLKERMEKKL